MPTVPIDQAMLLASEHFRAGRSAQAEAICRHVLAAQPNRPDALHLLGLLAVPAGRLDLATELVLKAIAAAPGNPYYHLNLANMWIARGRPDQAIPAYQQAIALHPDFAEAHNNLGIALKDNGQFDQAITCFGRALEINPDYIEAHIHLAHALLTTGDLAQGWIENQWRWKSCDSDPRRNFTQPLWNAARRDARSVLLTTDQGIGDTLQFVRYASMMNDRCETVLLQCHAELVSVLQGVAGVSAVFPHGATLPDFDAHFPLLSLPRVFATTLETIPAHVPYLAADPNRAAAWAAKLAQDRRLKIGLVWAGNPTHKNDRNRSIPLAALAPLSRIPGAVFVSLQKGSPAGQAPSLPDGMMLMDYTADLHDFADTAALIANLDLVISVDTAVVHLAGAMAKPVWTLLPFVADWRWFLNRTDSPWYPTMRLFRQPAAGDWSAVVSDVAGALHSRLEM